MPINSNTVDDKFFLPSITDVVKNKLINGQHSTAHDVLIEITYTHIHDHGEVPVGPTDTTRTGNRTRNLGLMS